MLLNKKHLTFLLVGVGAPSLATAVRNTIKGAEVDKCITCVTNSNANANFSFSWTDGTCSNDSTCGESSNPGAGPRCCVDDGCCSEDGCRSPDDTAFTSCSQCCDEVSSGDGGVDCIVRFWSDAGSDGVTLLAPWYNDETYQTGGCDDPNCPPCAVCSSRDEMELNALASGRSTDLGDCTAEDCDGMRNIQYIADPCQFNSPSNDCSCFCWLANPLLDDCPHLSDGVFNPVPVQDPAQDPVQEDAPPQDQGDAGDASSGGGGSGVDDTTFGDVPEGEKQVARTSGTSGAAPAATGSFGATMLLVVGCALAGTTIQLLVLS